MSIDKLEKIIEKVDKNPADLFGKDFFFTWEKSDEELKLVLDTAEVLRRLREDNISVRCFDSGLAISQFRDNSTRTRFSFASAVNALGLEIQDLDESTSQIAHGETTRETSVMISFLSDVIGIRDDMFLGAGNAYMREVAAALEESYQQGVLPQRPSIVNLQCDYDHPTQTMADLQHLIQHYGSLEALKGKKIAMSWAYSPSYGKPLSVPQGIISLMSRFGADLVLAHPPGYELVPETVARAGMQAEASKGSFTHTADMQEAFRDADIVYPKSWAPYHVMEKRTKLLKAQDQEGLAALEEACLAENRKYTDWTVDDKLMSTTRNGEALYMHCLPADISGVSCAEGEVSAAVFDKYQKPLYQEAGYKPWIIAAMILCSRFKKPGRILQHLYSGGRERAIT